MRQSSEHFMDEMLKDNSARTEPSDQYEQIAKVIDEKIDSAMNRMMEKFNSQVSQVNEPEDDESHDQVETPEETNEINQEGAEEENGNDTDG